ncbi:MAG TPA: pilus assembly protein TadG-related protein [Anaerolineae bacterium]|nr:pilus assembly protein TadG-related protein [Anaerolineae bacterium]
MDRLICDAGQATPRRRWERGQTLVVVAVLIVGLVAFLGLVIDGGNVYAERRQMQNAADAAALAGAREWARTQGSDPAAVYAAVEQYANQFDEPERGIDVVASAIITGTHVTVTVSETVPAYFIPVIGISSLQVGAVARAGVYEVTTSGCGLLPLTVKERRPQDPAAPEEWPVAGKTFMLWDSNSSDEFHGWLNLNGKSGNADELKCWLACEGPCNKYPMPPIELCDWENGTPGLKTAALQPIRDCLVGKVVLIPIYDIRCDKNPKDPKEENDEDAAQGVPAPTCVWVDDLGTANSNYRIVRFMPFYISAVAPTGNPKYIEGHIVEQYIPEEGCVKGYESGFSDVATVRLEPVD